MVKPGLGLFTGRRKSSSNVLEEISNNTAPSPDSYAPSSNGDPGAFRLMSRNEVEKAKERRLTMEREKSTSKFPRFSGFGGAANKGRVQSFEEDSPGSSKRDSKSSSGTQFSSSRPYANGQHGSTSTLPSSTDTSSDDNIFASLPPRPQIPQHNSSPSHTYSISNFRKTLPSLPKTSSGTSYKDAEEQGRERAMTASSYASTAIPPKLEADLNFGSSGFEDMFSDVRRNDSPDVSREVTGRSLLSEKRTFQAEPIRINPELDVEAPLTSWESRGSTDNLMSLRYDNNSPPPPPPPHKYSKYAPVASESPTLPQSGFQDSDAQMVRRSFLERSSYNDSSPDEQPTPALSSSSASFQTPASSRSSNYTTNTTPRAVPPPSASPYLDIEDDNMFAPVKLDPKPQAAASRQLAVPSVTRAPSNGKGRMMSQQEWADLQRRQSTQPPADDSDEDDYEDEEDAIKKREDEEIMRRKQQQMSLARETMRRTTTAPPGLPADGNAGGLNLGFPSETSLKADEWEDEDVPLGILAQHGFPSQTRNRQPTQPNNAVPSYFPDRPASAGANAGLTMGGHLPAFARNLPADPHSSFIGGGLVRPINRESLGFNNYPPRPASVAGDSVAGGMGMGHPMMYQDAGMSQPSLVDQIQMRDMSKQKYMGGASHKKPEAGPFTGMLGQQMNARGQQQSSTRMPHMSMMNGMNGMNPMMNMMGGQMPMMGMGMNQMGYPMGQQNDFMQMQQMQHMQQMIAMRHMQLQQMQMQNQDPRMSMAMPNNGFGGDMMGNGSFLGVPGGMSNGIQNQQNRPMSFVTVNGSQQPHASMGNFMSPGPGYTPSIAPSERSNIGMSARYRPVANNNSDARSTGTSLTMQATGGVSASRPGVIKGILKPQTSPRINVDDDEGDWGKMAARKSKFGTAKNQYSNDLEQLTKGLNT